MKRAILVLVQSLLVVGGCGGRSPTDSSPPPVVVNNPVPSVTGVVPSSATAGGAAFTVRITGSNFVAASGVRWNGAARPTTFVNAGQVTADLSAADIAAPGTAQVTVVTPAPGGGTSSQLAYPIVLPAGALVDDALNTVTWLADANLAASNRLGLPVCTPTSDTKGCINASGSMTYQAATAWVAAMNAINYLGHTTWQLPTTPFADPTCSLTGPANILFAFNCSGSALGSLFYTTLHLTAPNPAVTVPNGTVGPFSNLQPYLYWSKTVPPNGIGLGSFSFNTGFQGSNSLPNFLYVLPLIRGKIPGTPTATGTGLQVNPGGQTVYDPVTNVTWLANANVAASNTFGLPPCKDPNTPRVCVNPDGAMHGNSIGQFIANMNSGTGYLGQTTWELPAVDPSCDVMYVCAAPAAGNPFGELFYGQLGGHAGAPMVPTTSAAVGRFKNLQPYLYWTCQGATVQSPCQAAGPTPNFEWSFSFGNGFTGTDVLANDFYVLVYFVGRSS